MPEEYIDELRVKARFQAASTRTQITSTAAQEAGIPIGQNVGHAKFGQGVVLAIEGSGAHTRVQVEFKEQGVKWLVLAYANLTIMDELSHF